MADGMMRLLLTFSFVLYSAAAIAEELPDPTRPPAVITAPGIAPAQWAAVRQPSGLQSTIISESRRAAIIDGKTVELGAMHGNARLVEVNEGSVVLRGAQTQRLLTLFPGVKIKQREIKNVLPESEAQPEEISTTPSVQKEKK